MTAPDELDPDLDRVDPEDVPELLQSLRELRARVAELDTFARWLISLDDPDRLDERQAITLPDIISRARTALGEETNRDR